MSIIIRCKTFQKGDMKMEKILDKIGAVFFWGVMIFLIVGGIFMVVEEGLVAIPFLLLCCVVVGVWSFFWYIGTLKPLD